ncbi:MAG TPA: hypothetical protein VGR62_12200 [Candidatus Binatia bacterium]|jgi:hypothetical protein|nr:hypothetical protein [Candidatus Binatia bacterium]
MAHHPRIPRRGAGIAALLIALLAARPAAACVIDTDCDDANACTGTETCVTGSCQPGTPLPDLDGDGTCDLSDPNDATLTITKIRLRRNAATQGDKSSIKGIGFFVTAPPGDTFDPLAGFSLRVVDGIGLDVTRTFAAADCKSSGLKTKCKTPDRALQATWKPLLDTPEVVQWNLVLRKMGLAGPFNGPIQLTITQTGTSIDRHGSVMDCVLKITGLACRQF